MVRPGGDQYNAVLRPAPIGGGLAAGRWLVEVLTVSSQKSAAISETELAVAEPKRKEKTKARQKPRRMPRYHVVLWNDDDHSYEYVIGMLQKLFGYDREKGYQIAKEVDTQGRAICLTTTLEHAELKRDQIHAFGPDKFIPRCKGSMSATIEPETTES